MTSTVCLDTLPLTGLAFLGRSIEILYPGPPLFPSELIPLARDFVDQDMAHRADIPLSGDNALELLEKRRADMAARASAKGHIPSVHPPSSTSWRPKKRVTEDTSPDWTGKDIIMKFPSTASAYSNFDPHYDEANKLLWPEDVAWFKEHGRVPTGRLGVHHTFQV